MSSKKYKLLLAVLLLLVGETFAQNQPGPKSTSGYDVYDSTVITRKRQPQQNEFWNNAYNFPSKPRNMWEIGISGGAFNISGDVPTVIPTFGFSAHVRKAFGYVFSLRLEYLNGTAKGLSWNPSYNFARNGALSSIYSAPWQGGTTVPGVSSQGVFYNYKNKTQDLSLQGIITLNNIRFHKNKTSFVIYAGAGGGATLYETKINALNEGAGTDYSDLYATIIANNDFKYSNRKDVRKALKDGMDDTYETDAENAGERRPKMGDQTLRFSTTILAGVAYKLSKRINLAIENRHTFIHDDLLDGQQWQEQPTGDPALTGNWDSYNYLSLGLNFNLGAKSVEPLWWLNPLDYVYGELNNPRHIKLPKPVFDDDDGDGVLNQLDREPNTPAGCPVDTHGVTRDTDGDGVPDCKDKQLITPTECQPVDADGIGKCPDPACCDSIKVREPEVLCPTDYPSLTFKVKSGAGLTRDMKAMLDNVAAKLKANPTCKVLINGYPETSKAAQAVCQKRVDAVKQYLVTTGGISSDRITTSCDPGTGDKDTIDIKSN